MTNPPNLIWTALDEKLADKDMCVFRRLLATAGVDRLLRRLNVAWSK